MDGNHILRVEVISCRHRLALPGYRRHSVPRGGIFLFRYIHISLLDAGSFADTCVTPGGILLFSLRPNFAVRYCR